MGALFDTYRRYPVEMVRGEGCYVWDRKGRQYLDFTSGIAVLSLGHAHPELTNVLKTQAEVLWHTSNLFSHPWQEALAEKLVHHSVFDRVLFVNSGTEANEAAIKLVRRHRWLHHGQQLDPHRSPILVFQQSFHGRTMGALSATAQPSLQEGFTPLLEGFIALPYNDPAALEAIHGEVTAIMLELVQGEGGVRVADAQWIQALVERAQAYGVPIVVDEVQTGMGRTGRLFAYEAYGFEPDVMTLAKGLGSGFPIGAMLAKAYMADAFTAGTHGSTFGGGPLATAVAGAVVDKVAQDAFLANVRAKSETLMAGLNQLLNEASTFHETGMTLRGLGLLIGIGFSDLGGKTAHERVVWWVDALRARGVLVLTAGRTVMRILPPLIVSDHAIAQFLSAFQEVMEAERKT